MRVSPFFDPSAVCLLLLIHQSVNGHPEFAVRQKCPIVDRSSPTRVYVSTSDRELFPKDNRGRIRDSDIPIVSDDVSSASSTRQRVTSADHFDANFYDPSYGFSKESISNLKLRDHGKDPAPEEPIAYEDISNIRGDQRGKSYSRQPLRYREENAKRLKNFVKKDPSAALIADDSKHAASYIHPLNYYKSFAEPTKAEDVFGSTFQQENGGSYPVDSEEYDQYLKDVFRKLQKYSSSAPRDEFAEALRHYKQPESELGNDFSSLSLKSALQSSSSYKPYDDYPKKQAIDQNRYLAELYEQSRVLSNYYDKLKNSGVFDTEITESDEYNTLKLRESARGTWNKRPTGPGRNSRGKGKHCSGSRCGGRSRRPRFSLF